MVKRSARRTRRTQGPVFKARVALAEGAADVFGSVGPAGAPVDLAPRHAKIGQLALEDDIFLNARSPKREC